MRIIKRKKIVPPREEEISIKTLKASQKRDIVKKSFFSSFKGSLIKKRKHYNGGLIRLLCNQKIDNRLFEELEEELLITDIGIDTTRKIITKLKKTANRKQFQDIKILRYMLKLELQEILKKVEKPLSIRSNTLFIILMVGVNGVGKTTAIGKLAYQLKEQGKSVMLVAGDTFRVAAIEQLQIWGERNKIPVISHHIGVNPTSVIFDATQVAKKNKIDTLIIDTSGRLQNQSHLMEELRRIVRVITKINKEESHEVMLVIDSTTGLNAINQVKLFHKAVEVTGIIISKLDSTAKGGAIFAIADQFSIPIRYIGTGEGIEDLHPFHANDFVDYFLPELVNENAT